MTPGQIIRAADSAAPARTPGGGTGTYLDQIIERYADLISDITDAPAGRSHSHFGVCVLDASYTLAASTNPDLRIDASQALRLASIGLLRSRECPDGDQRQRLLEEAHGHLADARSAAEIP